MTPWQLRQVTRSIRRGGIVAYPTEAVFGLGCDPSNATAVLRLLALKRRPIKKGLILIASDLDQLLPYLAPLDQKSKNTLLKSWPGPNTWVVPANPAIPHWINGQYSSVAIRVTAHPVAKMLCDELHHPLISTSANPTGHPAARNVLQLRQYFRNELDFIITGNNDKSASPTRIKNLVTGELLRA